MKKMAIITYADNKYEENLELDFLNSLFSIAHYSDYIYILNYGISEDILRRIKERYPVIIIDCELKESIFTSRYRDICKVVDIMPDDIDLVVTIDSGDVWFQESLEGIKTIEKKNLALVTEERIWGSDEWTNKCLENFSKDKKNSILKCLRGKPVKNSGVIVADKGTMKKLAHNVYYDICEYGFEFFGIDQIFVNYEIATLFNDEFTSLPDIYNYVVVSNGGRYIVENEILYKKTGEKIIVVHNAGGNWRVIKRPFVNNYTNEQQYIIENIYSIN